MAVGQFGGNLGRQPAADARAELSLIASRNAPIHISFPFRVSSPTIRGLHPPSWGRARVFDVLRPGALDMAACEGGLLRLMAGSALVSGGLGGPMRGIGRGELVLEGHTW